MEWLVVAAFLVFIGGIAVVTVGAVKHADKQQIDLAERLLIYTHSPAWNSQHIKSLKWEKIPENLHIFNWGVRGHLLPEVSVRRWREVGNAIPERLRPIEG